MKLIITELETLTDIIPDRVIKDLEIFLLNCNLDQKQRIQLIHIIKDSQNIF